MLTLGLKPADALFPIAFAQSQRPSLKARPRFIDWIGSWTGDDLIGSQTYAYDPTYLASRLPAAGSSFTDTRTYSGGGGEYTMTVLVSRTA